MKLAIISDMHANLFALEAVLKEIRKQDVEGIICAGDIVNAGSQPSETVEMIRAECKWIICGNNDRYITEYHKGVHPDWNDSLQWANVLWTHRRLSDELIDYLDSLPEEYIIKMPGTSPIRVVHGRPGSISKGIYPDQNKEDIEQLFEQLSEEVLVCAHTHVLWKIKKHQKLMVNSGAVSGAISGSIGAQYSILSWQDSYWDATQYSVPYNLSDVRDSFTRSELLEYGGAFARASLLSIETGKNISGDFVSYAYKIAEQSGYKGCKTVPNKIWQYAEKTWNWDGNLV